jgi:hypothetical protein
MDNSSTLATSAAQATPEPSQEVTPSSSHRHIAIIGMSFCGSTVLSYVLGSLPNVKTIGESHWLVDKTTDGKLLGCVKCGPACSVINDDLRSRLTSVEAQWYRDIATALNSKVLVSSDKNLDTLLQLDPTGNFEPLVLFKRPDNHARSYARVIESRGDQPPLKWYATAWAKHYAVALNLTSARYLLIDDFVNYPEAVLERLAAWLETTADSSALRYWEFEHHAIGGNFNPYVRKTQKPDELEIRAREWPSKLDADIEGALAESTAWQVYGRLLAHPNRIRP